MEAEMIYAVMTIATSLVLLIMVLLGGDADVDADVDVDADIGLDMDVDADVDMDMDVDADAGIDVGCDVGGPGFFGLKQGPRFWYDPGIGLQVGNDCGHECWRHTVRHYRQHQYDKRLHQQDLRRRFGECIGFPLPLGEIHCTRPDRV